MKTEILEEFMEVARQKNISNAAKVLNMPQQTLSNHVKSLERELEIKLFERNTQGVELTAAGQEIYYFSKECISEYYNMLNRINPAEPVEKETIKIGSKEAMIRTIVSKIFAQSYNKNYPFELEISQKYQQEIIEDVLHDNIDLGLIIQCKCDQTIFPQFNNNFEFIPLYLSRPYVWVNKSNPLATKKSISFPQIVHYNILTVKEFDQQLFSVISKFNGVHQQNSILCADFSYVIQLLAQDIGLVLDFKTNGHLMYENELNNQAEPLMLIPKRQNLKYVSGILIKKEKKKNKNLRELINLFLQYKTI